MNDILTDEKISQYKSYIDLEVVRDDGGKVQNEIINIFKNYLNNKKFRYVFIAPFRFMFKDEREFDFVSELFEKFKEHLQ